MVIKWSKQSIGHYISKVGKAGTVHVVGKSVYITVPGKKREIVKGKEAERFMDSAQEFAGILKPSTEKKKPPKKTSSKSKKR